MEQSELRIGNWVLDNDKPVQIFGLQASGRIVIEDRMYDDGKKGIEPRPILINQEIIDKCGFVKKGNARYLDGFFIYMPGSSSSDFGFGFKGIGLIKSVKYLHELQNIYFILSGEELKINL